MVHKWFSTTKIATAKIRTLDLRSDFSLLACKEGYHLEIRFRILKVRVSRLVSMCVILLYTDHNLTHLRKSVRLCKLHLKVHSSMCTLEQWLFPYKKNINKCPGGGEVLKEFLGGDVLLGPWNP